MRISGPGNAYLFWFQCKRLCSQFQAGDYGPIGRLGGALWRETKCCGKRQNQNKVPKHSQDTSILSRLDCQAPEPSRWPIKVLCRPSKSRADRTHLRDHPEHGTRRPLMALFHRRSHLPPRPLSGRTAADICSSCVLSLMTQCMVIGWRSPSIPISVVSGQRESRSCWTTKSYIRRLVKSEK